MPRTSERGGPQTRARILEVSNRLFIERGYDLVTVAQVAKEAGVSSVTVFNHFPRKEDLFLDRADEVVDLLRSTVRGREAGVTVVEALRTLAFRLADEPHPFSGLDPRAVPFFRTIAESPALVARAREIGAGFQRALTDELRRDAGFEGDSILLGALFLAGYSAVLVETARQRLAGEGLDAVTADHRVRLGRLFAALENGFGNDA